jgi:hypothetical protein
MLKELQMQLLRSYLGKGIGEKLFCMILLSIICGICSLITNAVIYDAIYCVGIIKFLNICWSVLIFISICTGLALLTTECDIISIANHSSLDLKYNNLSIKDRKTLLLFSFYAYTTLCCTGGIFIYILCIIIYKIFNLIAITLPNKIIDQCIKDESEKVVTNNKPMIQKYDDLLDKK